MSKRFAAEELAKLREIAEAATPGPWRIPGANVFRVVAPETTNQGDPRYRWAVIADTDPQSVSGEEAAATARYIATFDPPTVIAMLDEIERLRREREVLARDTFEFLRSIQYGAHEQDPYTHYRYYYCPSCGGAWCHYEGCRMNAMIQRYAALTDGEKDGENNA